MTGNEPAFKYSIQDTDTIFKKQPTFHGEVGYVYSCSYDSFINKTYGQDYFVFRVNEENFNFVLCDGVGQSYCGELAAKFLGNWLFKWVENLDVTSIHDPFLADRLTSELNTLRIEAQEEVENHTLPNNLPDLLLTALNEQKKYGSETVFIAGRIDFRGKCTPPLLNLFWLGDSQFRLFDKKGKELKAPGNWVNSERWSTKNGVGGTEKVNHWAYKLRKEKKLIVHSDGVKTPVYEQLFDLTNKPDEMNLAIENLRSLPGSDDVSMLTFDFTSSPFSFLNFLSSILGIKKL